MSFKNFNFYEMHYKHAKHKLREIMVPVVGTYRPDRVHPRHLDWERKQESFRREYPKDDSGTGK